MIITTIHSLSVLLPVLNLLPFTLSLHSVLSPLLAGPCANSFSSITCLECLADSRNCSLLANLFHSKRRWVCRSRRGDAAAGRRGRFVTNIFFFFGRSNVYLLRIWIVVFFPPQTRADDFQPSKGATTTSQNNLDHGNKKANVFTVTGEKRLLWSVIQSVMLAVLVQAWWVQFTQALVFLPL